MKLPQFKFLKMEPVDREAGVTLLLTVLIISSMVLISLTVAGLVVQELRASRSSLLTEPAIKAAETAGEQGLYAYKQTGDIPDLCASNAFTTTVTGACTSTNLRIKKSVEYAPALITLEPGEVREIFIYDPDLPNDNPTMLRSGAPIYTHVIIEHISGLFDSRFNVEIKSFDDVEIAEEEIRAGDKETFSIYPIYSAADKRVSIKITPGDSRATIRISTLGIYEGLPSYPVIRAEGCRAQQNIANCNVDGTEVFRRRLDITVPNSKL